MENLEVEEKMMTSGLVTLKQFRKNGWLPDGHDGELRYTHCFTQITPQAKNGVHVTGLTEEMEAEFTRLLSLTPGTLSKYNKDYWGAFRVKVPKEGVVLDLSDPKDRLTYYVLRANTAVANSEAEKADSPDADYVLTSIEQEAKASNAKNKVRKLANKKFYNMNIDEMRDFLVVFGDDPGEASNDFIEDTITKIIDDTPEAFLEIVNDPTYETRLFIGKCVKNRLLKKAGSKYSLMPGGDIIGFSIEETIAYLKDPVNQEVYVSLKNRLNISNK